MPCAPDINTMPNILCVSVVLILRFRARRNVIPGNARLRDPRLDIVAMEIIQSGNANGQVEKAVLSGNDAAEVVGKKVRKMGSGL